jgi:hypothetical protein
MADDCDLFWEISGPRKYLNIPTPVPDRWRAELRSWSRDLTVVAWASTESAAREGCVRQLVEFDELKKRSAA